MIRKLKTDDEKHGSEKGEDNGWVTRTGTFLLIHSSAGHLMKNLGYFLLIIQYSI